MENIQRMACKQKTAGTPYYIHKNGSVSTQAPAEQESYSEYISDMSHPVPYTANPTTYRTKNSW